MFKRNKKLIIKGYRTDICRLASRLASDTWCWKNNWNKDNYDCSKTMKCDTQIGCFKCLLKNAKVKIYD